MRLPFRDTKSRLLVVFLFLLVLTQPFLALGLCSLAISAPIHYFVFGKLMKAQRWWLLLAIQLAVSVTLTVILWVAWGLDRLI